MILVPLLCGAVLGLGVLLLYRGLVPPRVALAEELERLTAPAPPIAAEPAPRLERVALDWFRAVGIRLEGRAADLRVTGRSAARHAADKLVGALAGAALPPAVLVAASLAGLALPAALPWLAAPIGAAIGFVLPDRTLREAAARERGSFRHALSGYLDLVTVLLAGGSHIESALVRAAQAGDGRAFSELRRTLDWARVHRTTSWTGLRQLGEDLGVRELRDLAATVSLAAAQGASPAASLTAKASTLRTHQLAEAEAEAEAVTERMTVPSVVLLAGFVVFVVYPAVVRILGLV